MCVCVCVCVCACMHVCVGGVDVGMGGWVGVINFTSFSKLFQSSHDGAYL